MIVRPVLLVVIPKHDLASVCRHRGPGEEPCFIASREFKIPFAVMAKPMDFGFQHSATIGDGELFKQPAFKENVARQYKSTGEDFLTGAPGPRATRKAGSLLLLELPTDDNHIAVSVGAATCFNGKVANFRSKRRSVELEGDGGWAEITELVRYLFTRLPGKERTEDMMFASDQFGEVLAFNVMDKRLLLAAGHVDLGFIEESGKVRQSSGEVCR